MIVIGDVHGCYKTLVALIEKLPHSDLCFVGDLIDRGPDSKKVVDLVINMGYKCVLGNHEDMALRAKDSTHASSHWFTNGGNATVLSFGMEMEYALDWFSTLPYYISHGDFIISHSNYAAGLEEVDSKTYTIWNRDLETTFKDARINIIGHTPLKNPVQTENLILIDTGCVFGGYLSAFDTETDRFYFQDNIEA